MKNMPMAEAAEILCCSVEHVRKLIHEGELVAFNIGTAPSRRKLIVDGHSIESFMARKRVEPGKHVTEAPKMNRRNWQFVESSPARRG